MKNIEIRTVYKPDGIYLISMGSKRREKGPYNQENLPNIYDISSTVNNPVYRDFFDIPESGQSLQDMRPDVAAEFICLDSEREFYEKHKTAYLKPKDIKCGTNEYAWFKCSNPKCQHIWKARVDSRTARKYIKDEETQQYIDRGYTVYKDNKTGKNYVYKRINCPLCYNNKNESIYEKYLYQLLQPELTKRGFTLEKHVFLSRFDSSYAAGTKDQDY